MARLPRFLLPLLLTAACGAPAAAPVAPVPAPPRPPATASAPSQPAPVPAFTVRGRLLGHDGKPMRLAHVHLDGKTVQAGDDGAFQIAGSEAGFAVLRLTGVDHAERDLAVMFETAPQEVEVRLGTYERQPALTPSVIFFRGAGRPHRVLAKKGADGVFTAAVVADGTELAYQVAGIVQVRSVNGPEADAFEYDGGGDYRSLLHPPKGDFTLRIDPAKMPAGGERSVLRFTDPKSRSARVARLYDDAVLRGEAVSAHHPLDAAWRADLTTALGAERDPDMLAALRIAYLVPPPDPSAQAAEIARALLDGLPAGSSLWGFWPESALAAVALSGRGEAADGYLDQVLDGLRDHSLAAAFLAARVRGVSAAGREHELARLYPMMRQRFGDTAAAREVTYLDPARRIRPGRPLPEFSLKSISDPSGAGKPITPASLRGKVVLIDFWGTWCMPCRQEVKFLTQAFEAHKREGFVIVSIAAHDHLQAVQNFRASIAKMPWTHVVLDEKDEDATLKLFENHGFPQPILVGGDGTIVAYGDEIRGEGLEPAVARALAAKAKGGPRG